MAAISFPDQSKQYVRSLSVTQNDLQSLARIRAALRNTKMGFRWNDVASADLAEEHWILSGDLVVGMHFPHSLAKAHKRLFPPKQDQMRFVILTENAIFLARHTTGSKQIPQGSEDQNAELLAEIIHNYDRSKKGGLNEEEVRDFLQEAGGGRPTDEELEWVIGMAAHQKVSSLRKGDDSVLRIDHLRGAARAWTEYREKENLIQTIFRNYDSDANEQLNKEELTTFIRDYIQETGECNDDEELATRVEQTVDRVFEVCDMNHDGHIQKHEMLKALVVIQNQGDIENTQKEERSLLVIKMYVKLKDPLRLESEQGNVIGFELDPSVLKKLEGAVNNATLTGEQTEQFSRRNRKLKISVVLTNIRSQTCDLHFSVIVKGPKKEIINFKLSKFKLGDELKRVGWETTDVEEVSHFYPDNLEITDAIPLTEVLVPVTEDAFWSKRHSRDSGIFQVVKTAVTYPLIRAFNLVMHGRIQKVPVAVKVRFSLPFPAHTVTLDMQRKLCKATGDALSKMNNQIVLFEDAVRIREVRAAHGLWQRDVVSLGLKWIEVGSEKPQTGTEIENSGLSAALPQKVEFSQHEIMDEFRLGELSYDSFIKGGDKYFKPDVESLIQDSNFTPGQIMDDTEYKYDIFLSYRQISDKELVAKLYDKIKSANPSLRVFLDKMEMRAGESFIHIFSDAITHSRMVVLVISRHTFRCKCEDIYCKQCNQNIASLDESKEDSVLLEHELALELMEMGRVRKIVPLFVGDLEESSLYADQAGLYRDFFDQFKPCLAKDTLPQDPAKSLSVKRRAYHHLSRDPRLTLKMETRRNTFMSHPEIRHSTPSLLMGRSVKDTLSAITELHGIKLKGIPEDTIAQAVIEICETHERMMSEEEAADKHMAPRVEHTSVEILVDAFDAKKNSGADSSVFLRSEFQLELSDMLPSIQVYDAGMKVVHDDGDGLGALLIKSAEVTEDASLTTWNIKSNLLEVAGRGIRRTSALLQSPPYLRIYFQTEEDSGTGVKELLYQTETITAGSTSSHPNWPKLQLRFSEKFTSDGAMCFSLDEQNQDELTDDQDHKRLKQKIDRLRIGTPVARKSASSEISQAAQHQLSRRSLSDRSFQGHINQLSRSMSKKSVAPSPTSASKYGTKQLIELESKLGHARFGVVKAVRDINDGYSDKEWVGFEGRVIGVEFQNTSFDLINRRISKRQRDDLVWLAPHELEPLHVGDKLDTIIFECYEDGSHTLIGSCCTTLGALASNRAELLFLSNDAVLGTWPFTIQTKDSMEGYTMGRFYALRARSSIQCRTWAAAINKAASQAQHNQRYRDIPPVAGIRLWLHDQAIRVNESSFFIFVVYIMIILSFFVSIYQHEVVPNPQVYFSTSSGDIDSEKFDNILNWIRNLEMAFTFIFTFDLFVNLIANWWMPFFSDPFNYLDIFVVVVSHVSTWQETDNRTGMSATSGMRVMRIFRLARVLKLSRVFLEIRIIVEAIAKSIGGVLGALAVLLVFTSLGSIIATSLFSSLKPDNFGIFSQSLFTMWQVGLNPSTGYDVARELMDSIGVDGWHETSDYMAIWYIGFVFGTYSFIVYVFLNNIVVVVFLREFLASTADNKRKRALDMERKKLHVNGDLAIKSPLDPLLQEMINFRDQKELSLMISDLYKLIQPMARRKIEFLDLQQCLRAMGIHMNRDDWYRLTSAQLRPGKNTLDEQEFSNIMHEQLRLFASGQIISLMGFTSSINPLGESGENGLPPIELQRAVKMLSDVESSLLAHDRLQQGARSVSLGNNTRTAGHMRHMHKKDEEIQRLKAKIRGLKGHDATEASSANEEGHDIGGHKNGSRNKPEYSPQGAAAPLVELRLPRTIQDATRANDSDLDTLIEEISPAHQS